MNRVETSSGEDGKLANNELIYKFHIILWQNVLILVKRGQRKKEDLFDPIKNIFSWSGPVYPLHTSFILLNDSILKLYLYKIWKQNILPYAIIILLIFLTNILFLVAPRIAARRVCPAKIGTMWCSLTAFPSSRPMSEWCFDTLDSCAPLSSLDPSPTWPANAWPRTSPTSSRPLCRTMTNPPAVVENAALCGSRIYAMWWIGASTPCWTLPRMRSIAWTMPSSIRWSYSWKRTASTWLSNCVMACPRLPTRAPRSCWSSARSWSASGRTSSAPR